MKSDTTTNAISSPESEDGLSLCDGPDLKTPEESGPAPVPVSRFRALAKDRATPMSGTCGPLFTASSPSAVLQRYLESRLRARMDVNGSPEFALTWKTWDMPAGEPICALRASERRTAGNGCIGLPTPQANKNTKNSKDPKRMKENGAQTCLADAAHLAGWPTPMAGTKATETYNEAGNTDSSRKTVELCGWPTPEAEEARRGFQNRNNGKRGTQKSLTTVAVESLAAWPTPQEDNANNSAGHKGTTFSDLPTVAGWATPRPSDDNQTRRTDASMEREISRPNRGASLAIDAYVAGLATPRAEDAESAGMRHSRGVADTLSAQAGQDASRSNAETARPAGFRLNPRFSLWLMGYPAAWASCGERAMQSFQKSRRRS